MRQFLFLMFTVGLIGTPFFSYAHADISERLSAVETKIDDLSTRVSALETQERSRWSCSATCELEWDKDEGGSLQIYRSRESVIASAAIAADAFQNIVDQCNKLTNDYKEKQGTQVRQDFFVSSESGRMAPNLKNACIK